MNPHNFNNNKNIKNWPKSGSNPDVDVIKILTKLNKNKHVHNLHYLKINILIIKNIQIQI